MVQPGDLPKLEDSPGRPSGQKRPVSSLQFLSTLSQLVFLSLTRNNCNNHLNQLAAAANSLTNRLTNTKLLLLTD